MKLPSWIKDILTGIDGVSFDIGRLSWVVTEVGILGAAVLNWMHNSTIPLGELGAALGGNTVLHGAAIGMKASTEPQAPAEKEEGT